MHQSSINLLPTFSTSHWLHLQCHCSGKKLASVQSRRLLHQRKRPTLPNLHYPDLERKYDGNETDVANFINFRFQIFFRFVSIFLNFFVSIPLMDISVFVSININNAVSGHEISVAHWLNH